MTLAEKYGTNYITICNAVRRAGGVLRSPGWPRRAGYRRKGPEGWWVTLAVDDPMVVMATQGRARVVEHRLTMARHIGRPLRRDEQVHHINGDRYDNRIENLQLRHGNHGSGVRLRCLDCGSNNVVPEEL